MQFVSKSIDERIFKKKKHDMNQTSLICDSFELTEIFELCDFEKDQKITLFYRGSANDFSIQTFHEKCDNLNNLLFIILSNNNVFGAFSHQNWSGNKLKEDNESFLFSFTNSDGLPLKLKSEMLQFIRIH